mmetsp:Transcript_11590/g.29713  ORF Transcript_11590/g.29713 Transcript_11590/m.29713 type:complete len:238 (-) Transcript_11590:130-843(-)
MAPDGANSGRAEAKKPRSIWRLRCTRWLPVCGKLKMMASKGGPLLDVGSVRLSLVASTPWATSAPALPSIARQPSAFLPYLATTSSRLSKEVATTRPPEPSCLTSPAEKLKSPSPSTSSACEELYSPAALCRCRCRCGPPCGPSSPPPPLPPVSALPLAPGGVSPRRSGAAAPCLLPPGPRRFSTPARRFLSRLRSRFPICAMCREAAERENSWHAVRCPGGEFSGVVLLAETCVVT